MRSIEFPSDSERIDRAEDGLLQFCKLMPLFYGYIRSLEDRIERLENGNGKETDQAQGEKNIAR